MQHKGHTSCSTSLQTIHGNCFPCLDVCICQHSQQPVNTEFRPAKLFSNCHYYSFDGAQLSAVMWWSPHNSSSIQQPLLGITAVQVTMLWLYLSIIQSCTTQSTNILMHQSTTGMCHLMIITLWFVMKFYSFCFSIFNLPYPSPNNTYIHRCITILPEKTFTHIN
jgi:hypothetical protein